MIANARLLEVPFSSLIWQDAEGVSIVGAFTWS